MKKSVKSMKNHQIPTLHHATAVSALLAAIMCRTRINGLRKSSRFGARREEKGNI